MNRLSQYISKASFASEADRAAAMDFAAGLEGAAAQMAEALELFIKQKAAQTYLPNECGWAEEALADYRQWQEGK